MSGGFPGLPYGICNGTDIGTDTSTSHGTPMTAVRGSYGSYVQLVASTVSDTSWCELSFHVGTINNAGGAIKLAVGASGSETAFISNVVASTYGGYSGTRISFPICIPAGTRIAAAAQCFNGGGETLYYANAQLYDGAFETLEGVAGYDSIGFDATNAIGTTITASGSINTKGSYVQLVASTAKDYCGFYIIPDCNSVSTATHLLIDIAIGGAGSELVIVPNWWQAPLLDKMRASFIPIRIPSGTRIAARSQSATASQQIGLSLQAAYL
jgi:hypothetical protein